MGSGVGGGNSSIIGLVVAGFFRPESRVWIVCILTVVYFFLFYALFKWWIIKFDVKTPGRGGSDYDEQMAFAQEIATGKAKELNVDNPEVLKAQLILQGLGGKENIKEIEACFTRLRVVMHDMSKFNEDLIMKTGCNGINKVTDEEVQIVYGAAINLIYKTVIKEMEK
ncbi:MAG: glucose PTS transporter subunit EIIB [Erysipelotrichaceae bacterium]